MDQSAGFKFTSGIISIQFKLVLSGHTVATEVLGGWVGFCFVFKDRDNSCNLRFQGTLQQNSSFA